MWSSCLTHTVQVCRYTGCEATSGSYGKGASEVNQARQRAAMNGLEAILWTVSGLYSMKCGTFSDKFSYRVVLVNV